MRSFYNDPRCLDALYIICIIIIILFLLIPLVGNAILSSPDASCYLDAGRNIFSGKGFVSSYNLYQFWPGKYFPLFPYTQPLYPILAGLFITLWGWKAAVYLNVFLCTVNAVMIYQLLRLYTGRIESFLMTLGVCLSINFYLSALQAWTEQLHLFFLLSAITVFLKYERSHWMIGVLFGLGCLVRVASAYNAFAFALAIAYLKGFSKESLKFYLFVFFGFVLVLGSYELFCFFKYGFFYPQYSSAAKIHTLASSIPGAFYKESIPVLNSLPHTMDVRSVFTTFNTHIKDFYMSFGWMKETLALCLIFAVYEVLRKKHALMTIMLFQGFFVIGLYAFIYYWYDQLTQADVLRYSLVPFTLLWCAGFLSISNLIKARVPGPYQRAVVIVFILMMFYVLSHKIISYVQWRTAFMNVIHSKGFQSQQDKKQEIYDWIKANTPQDCLVASEWDQDGFLFSRPFVSLPKGELSGEKNLSDFLRIYRPDYVFVLAANARMRDSLKTMGFEEEKTNELFVLLGRK